MVCMNIMVKREAVLNRLRGCGRGNEPLISLFLYNGVFKVVRLRRQPFLKKKKKKKLNRLPC